MRETFLNAWQALKMNTSNGRAGSSQAGFCVVWFLVAICLDPLVADGDSTFVYAVQLSALTQVSPPQITLNWEVDPYGALSYTVYRKTKAETSWGAPLATLAGSATGYADPEVTVGEAYEYEVVKAGSLGYSGYGYIFSGIEVPVTENRGTVELVVATESVLGLDSELAQLESDLVGDGWGVIRHDVSVNETPDDVRSLILNDYWAALGEINTVFLLGHVPVLQSGYLNYDGHGSRPMAADAFYGDVYNDWPTVLTNSPSYLPSDVQLMVGRVDMYDLPGSASPTPYPSETELLRRYLNKDHRWRQKLIPVQRRALMGNRRGDEGGIATAASGYRNFEPFVGAGNTAEANIQDTAPAAQRWSSLLEAGGYLWAYGNGGGQDTAIGYLGTNGIYKDVWSTDLVDGDAKAAFVMVFGSHLGNWDHADNIIRSVLATPTMGLASFMSGEPHWFCHHMGLGETIGYSARLTMNNSTLYLSQSNTFTRAVYIALMGDPTLRMEPVGPPSELSAVAIPSGAQLSWTASSDPSVVGYYIYRAPSVAGPYSRISGSLVANTNFSDGGLPAGTYFYMVRAIARVTNPSGIYYDPSQGIFASASVAAPLPFRTQVHADAHGIALTWASQTGVPYHVEATQGLIPASWTNLSGTITATGTNCSWADPNSASVSRRFYRVVSP